jgi:hypothetical protein
VSITFVYSKKQTQQNNDSFDGPLTDLSVYRSEIENGTYFLGKAKPNMCKLDV